MFNQLFFCMLAVASATYDDTQESASSSLDDHPLENCTSSIPTSSETWAPQNSTSLILSSSTSVVPCNSTTPEPTTSTPEVPYNSTTPAPTSSIPEVLHNSTTPEPTSSEPKVPYNSTTPEPTSSTSETPYNSSTYLGPSGSTSSEYDSTETLISYQTVYLNSSAEPSGTTSSPIPPGYEAGSMETSSIPETSVEAATPGISSANVTGTATQVPASTSAVPENEQPSLSAEPSSDNNRPVSIYEGSATRVKTSFTMLLVALSWFL